MKLTEQQLLNKLIEYDKRKFYSDGLRLIDENQDVISKKYYEIIRYQITFLIETNNFLEANYIIKDELSVPYIPSEFEVFLKEKKKIVDYALKTSKPSFTSEDLDDIDKLNNSTLMAVMGELKKYNLNGYHNQLQNIFFNDKIADLTKSLLIACLCDCNLNQDFYVIKEEVTIKFNPSNVFDIRDGDNFKYIEENLNHLDDPEINTLELVKHIVYTYLLNIYPLVISEEVCDHLIAATLLLASKMTNCVVGNDKYDYIINNQTPAVIEMCKKINILLESI